jgi:hypothetical protein
MAGPRPGGIDNPAHPQGFPPGLPNFYRHLISGTPNPPGFHLNNGLNIFYRFKENLQRLLVNLGL